MKNKKVKPSKGLSNRKKALSDVSPSTSIPPLVEGQLRCFLRVTVSKVLWTVIKPPPVTLIRLRWWGESSNGTFFRPRDGHIEPKGVQSTARFPVRCGPKQLTSYLTDMGSLVLDVLTKVDHLPIARAQIPGIARLSLSHSINGYFTLVSPTSEKLGELQVTLALEPLTDVYDSSSSVPTTDISLDAQADQNMPVVSSLDHPLHINTGKEKTGRSSAHIPRGKDHLYFQESSNMMSTCVTRNPTSAQALPTNSHTSVDVLSVLLERGSKLRNAMVVSALKSDVESDVPIKDIPPPLLRDNAEALPLRPSSGQFLENILQTELQHSLLEEPSQHRVNTEDMAVDLLLGSVNGSVLQFWNGEGSPPESLSDHSSVLMDSELNDPQYDQSLLEHLFYKPPISDECLNEDEKTGTEKKPSPVKNIRVKSGGQQRSEVTDDFSGLGADKMAELEDVRFARVTVSELKAPGHSTLGKLSGKGKPPRPLGTKKCSYIVEVLFPLVSTGCDDVQLVPSEISKAVSSKVIEGAVMFQHQSLFPVRFSRSSIKQWSKMNVSFKIYTRNSFQKIPILIGTAMFPLSSIMQSESHSISAALPVQRPEGNTDKQGIGPLKVTFELASDKNGFSTNKKPAKRPQKAHLAEQTDGERGLCVRDHRRDPSPNERIHPGQSLQLPHCRSRSSSPHARYQASPHRSTQHDAEEPGVLLHTLLMVPDGKDLNCAPLQPNVYLNCKFLGSDEAARSAVSWGQKHPTFSFVQVAPVTLTSRLLERMKNNMMVIEVWLRASSSDHDKLLGLVKLPLHQFYMSFRDPKISELLLQSQYPVVAVDSYMPVVDVFTGNTHGNLRVCLAMGLAQQIAALQRMRDDELVHVSPLPRPVHMLDHRPHTETKASTVATANVLREHVFLLRVERVKGLTPLQSTVWGEADCYIQYSFPAQNESGEDMDLSVVESNVDLKAFRTETTLCVPDPVFGHTETHVLLAPPDVPVQIILLSSLANQGLRNGGGVQFEVWCRYYYPNVRDQLVARGLLPMSKLCAMVTMQKQGQTDTQLFSLPLVPRTDRSSDVEPQPSGLLVVSVQYKSRPMRSVGLKGGVVPSRSVILAVQVHRAAGLQAAAMVLADADSSLQYYAEVGVNSFVTMQLSFLPDSEVRSTRVAARSFCPEFEHHTEFCCNLLVQRDSGESVSLAELMQDAVAIFTIYNRDTRKMINTKSKDTVLGTVKIKLADLIRKRTGKSGWYGLSPPRKTASSHRLTSAGGLEISINFSHHADRERVITSARGLGWDVGQDSDDEADTEDEEALEEHTKTLNVSVSMPRAWLPFHCLLLPGHEDLQRSTYCYYRYKLYDQQTICSELRHPVVEESEIEVGLATVAFQGSRSVVLRRTRPLRWYLREERMEVQMWVAFGKEKRVRPHNADRLVGSAFVDLSALAKTSKHHQTISGVYSLFNRSAVNLGGAALRVHITATEDSAPHESQAAHSEELNSSGEDEECGDLPTTVLPGASQSPSRQRMNTVVNSEPHPATEVNSEDTFLANITVDRAMRLSLKGCPLAERAGALPSCCVSYATADAPGTATTALVKDSDCPVWDHQQECRLSKQLLVDPHQSLVFKVWHKGEVERVIGFASVDLSPLLSGFQSVCGWYNINDFSGQCQGQLKVSVSPLRAVQELRAQRQPAQESSATHSSALFSALPLCYQTTATYSSFPSHISRFSEQRISTPPGHLEKRLSDRSSVTDRHDEHMDNVRLFHQTLHEGERTSNSSLAGDAHSSSSAVFSALRKNLSELDDIQRYFSRKLTTPTFPKLSEMRGTSRQEDLRETDTTKLLLKSNHLVGEVNNIIKGLSEHQTEETSTLHINSDSPAVEHLRSDVDQLILSESESCETELHAHKDVRLENEDASPICSPTPRDTRQSSILPEDAQPHHSFNENPSDEDGDEDKFEDQEEDFEETLIQPRTLNEVTSVTDRTSPWTSLLSDPDMGSLESLELVEHHTQSNPYHAQDEVTNRRKLSPEVNPQSLTAQSQEIDSGSDDDGRSEAGSDLDTCRSEVHREKHQSPDGLDRVCSLSSISEVEGCNISNSETEESEDRPNVPSATESDAEPDDESDERTPKRSEPAEIPNFFLPTHHLEASMRALRMAPVFPSTAVESETANQSNAFRRMMRSRPNIPPSQRSEETRRIAKIFVSKFTEGH
ncbi:C2 domain-containing protein 3 isoform X2 [Triplophysa rosa]|uniref:C2 domain-containing protein 3 n=1 Tax=Triplophysa rosa TaxID=992332 RepID=A0A9W7TPN0_TRIRA|nr:C2 domain-containing protein 3 isoform X2 [Triplophysa rosa]KAI7800624.1 putative C2 domain-containing protein 3 [Triplophysa rosa]